MTIGPAARAILLSVALAVTVWAAFYDEPANAGNPGTIVAARTSKAPKPKSEPTEEANGEIPSIAVARLEVADPDKDPFRSTTWYVPPPPPKPLPPAPPTAPPFPWSYLGRFDAGDKTAILLGRQEESKTVLEGDTIDGTWRMTAIGEREIEFVYEPLNTKYLLPAGGKI